MPAPPPKKPAIEVESPFDPTPYETLNAGTSITLLNSPEDDIVLRALATLAKYADKKEENVLFLYQKGILKQLLTMTNSKHPVILRFVLKLIATFLALVELAKEWMFIHKIMEINEIFMTTKDDFIKEYCTQILSISVRDSMMATAALGSGVIVTIFGVLNTTDDPDVQLNTLLYLTNIFMAPEAPIAIPALAEFSCKVILCYLKSPLAEIRAATLEILDKLTTWKSPQMQELLKQQKVVEQLLDVIFEPTLREMHKKCFKIILTCAACPETASYFMQSEQFVHFCDWAMSCPGKHILPSVEILTLLSSKPELRQTLFDLTAEDTILSFLRTQDKLVFCKTCQAISYMSAHRYCCKKILTPLVLTRLIEMLRQHEVPTVPFHEIALSTLYNFMRRNEETLNMMIKFKYVDTVISSFLRGISEYTARGFECLLDLLYFFSMHRKLRSKLSDRRIYTVLFDIYEKETYELSKRALLILNQLVDDSESRLFFIEFGGAKRVLAKIKSTPNENLFKSSLLYIRHLFVYKRVAMTFLYAKAPLILSNFCSDVKVEIPLVNQIINMMHDIYLPIKFYRTNRLDFTDHIGNSRFYLVVNSWNGDFPYLEMMSEKECFRLLIYLVDFGTRVVDLGSRVERVPTEILTTGTVTKATVSKGDIPALAAKAGVSSGKARRSSIKRGSSTKQQRVSIKTTESTIQVNTEALEDKKLSSYLVWQSTPLSINYGGISEDPFLPKYAEKLKKLVFEKRAHDLSYSGQIATVAVFIDRLLSGAEDDEAANMSFFDVHLAELKVKLGTTVIPMGFLRYGRQCEKAVLFKALAEKVYIPCSLERRAIKGSNKYAYWNEVPLLADESYPEAEEIEKTYVTYAVVDLMKNVGRLMLLGTLDAERYCSGIGL